VNPETENEIINTYKGGMRISDICKEFGKNPPSIYAVLRKHHIKPNRGQGLRPKQNESTELGIVVPQEVKVTPPDVQEAIVRMRTIEGTSAKEISQTLGVRYSYVLGILKWHKAPGRMGSHISTIREEVLKDLKENPDISSNTICAKYGIRMSTLYRILQKEESFTTSLKAGGRGAVEEIVELVLEKLRKDRSISGPIPTIPGIAAVQNPFPEMEDQL
jgi:transposase-like protein